MNILAIALKWLPVSSIPIGTLAGILAVAVSTRGKDCSGYALLGCGVLFAAVFLVFVCAGLISGAYYVFTGTNTTIGMTGLILNMLIVASFLWAILK